MSFSQESLRVALFPFEIVSEKDLSYLQLEIPKIIKSRFEAADIAAEILDAPVDFNQETLRNTSIGNKCTHAIWGETGVGGGPVSPLGLLDGNGLHRAPTGIYRRRRKASKTCSAAFRNYPMTSGRPLPPGNSSQTFWWRAMPELKTRPSNASSRPGPETSISPRSCRET